MGKKDKKEVEAEVVLADAGVKKKKKKDKLPAVADAVSEELEKPKMTKEEKKAKKAAKESNEAKPVRESPRLAASKAAEIPSAALDAVDEDEEVDTGFKVHKYVPPPEPEDETLQCRDCGADFIFTIGEQEFFKSKGFDNKKTRCADCTAAKKARFNEGGDGGKGGKGKGKGKGKGDGGKGGGFACYNCGEEGHRSSDCTQARAEGKGGGKGGGGVCYAFQKGECNRGDSCKFSH